MNRRVFRIPKLNNRTIIKHITGLPIIATCQRDGNLRITKQNDI